MTALADVAAASTDVGATSSRLAKTARHRRAARGHRPGRGRDRGVVAVRRVAAAPDRRRLGVVARHCPIRGGRAVAAGRRACTTPSREIRAMSGAGSQKRRAELLHAIFGAATEAEQDFLRRLLGGELRQGALLGVMSDAVAKAAEVPAAAVRRAAMLGGSLPAVAAAALRGGGDALAEFRLAGRGVRSARCSRRRRRRWPMRSSGSAATRCSRPSSTAPGCRCTAPATTSRSSPDRWTTSPSRLPEVVDAVRALPVDTLVADGEAIALRPDGRPHKFQVTASRFGTRSPGPDRLPLQAFLFDVLASRRTRPARRAGVGPAGRTRPGRPVHACGWTGSSTCTIRARRSVPRRARSPPGTKASWRSRPTRRTRRGGAARAG